MCLQENNIYFFTKDMKHHKMYIPFYIAMLIVILYTTIHQFIIGYRSGMIAMNDFMGIRFILFGLLKFLDIEGFANSFMQYDIVAKKWKPYGYFFPILEIILWIAYLWDTQMYYRITINVATILLTGITSIGIYYALKAKKDIDCVCMGTKFPLPMSIINLVENIAMGAMAVFMVIRMGSMSMAQSPTMTTTLQQTNTWANCH